MTLRIALLAGACALGLVAGNLPAQEKEGKGSTSRELKTGDRRGWLGVSVQDVTPRLARERELTVSSGALVVDVIEDGPAEKAGVREGDVITKVGSTKIEGADDLTDAIRASAPEAQVTLDIHRGKDEKSLTVTLGKASRRGFAYAIPRIPHVPHVEIPRIPRFHVYTSHDVLGLSLARLNRQLGEYFEAPNGRGVLVEEVEEGSAGAKAGFKAGDVIVRVGKENVDDTRDVEEALDDVHKGDNVLIGIVRKGAAKELTVQADDLNHSRSYWFRSEDDLDDDDAASMGIHKHEFRLQMDHLKEQLRDIGKHIREKMEQLKQTLKKELKTARI